MLAGHRKIMVQSPPRSGKTVCMAHIAKNATNKQKTVLFFSHRKEINEQVFETFSRAGVDMGLVYIGTVGSIVRKLGKLPMPTLVLVDEAHHIKASQYQQILKYYHQAVQLFLQVRQYAWMGLDLTIWQMIWLLVNLSCGCRNMEIFQSLIIILSICLIRQN